MDESKELNILRKLVVALIAIPIGIPMVFGFYYLGGLIARDFWLWFMVPIGLPGIGIAHGIGLSLLVKAKWGYKQSVKEPWIIIKELCSYLSTWLIGYAVMKFMVGEWHL